MCDFYTSKGLTNVIASFNIGNFFSHSVFQIYFINVIFDIYLDILYLFLIDLPRNSRLISTYGPNKNDLIILFSLLSKGAQRSLEPSPQHFTKSEHFWLPKKHKVILFKTSTNKQSKCLLIDVGFLNYQKLIIIIWYALNLNFYCHLKKKMQVNISFRKVTSVSIFYITSETLVLFVNSL